MIFFKSMQKSTSFSQGLYMLSSAFPPHQNYRSVPEYMNNLFIGLRESVSFKGSFLFVLVSINIYQF